MITKASDLVEQNEKDLALFKAIRLNEAKALIAQVSRYWAHASKLQPGKELDSRLDLSANAPVSGSTSP